MSMFYIGQKIVAIKDHSQGIFKKGDEFTAFGFSKCCKQLVKIDVQIPHHSTACHDCGNYHNGVYFNQNSFTPIELSSTTFEDVIKEPIYNEP